MSPIILLNYPLDKTLLIREAEIFKELAESYTDPRYPGKELDNWLIYRHSSDYSKKIMDDFEIEGKARFYWLSANTVLPEHVDNNTTCSINFVLSDDAAPVNIQGKDYFYKQALLNTTIPHSVRNGNAERILFKISIFDKSFKDIASRIKYKHEC